MKKLKYSAYRVAPKLTFAVEQRLVNWKKNRGRAAITGGEARAKHDPAMLVAEAKHLRQVMDSASTIEEMVNLVVTSKLIRSNQRRKEIIAFLKLIEEHRPRIVCEIGAAGGGTLALFSHVADDQAQFLSVDLAYTDGQLDAFPLLLKSGQKLTSIAGDSHTDDTLERVKQWLDGRQIDFLFIDGDHSYEGVAQDYDLFSPLVRAGGIIGFHDIAEDYRTRYGVMTPSDVGGVPAFWKELKLRVDKAEEFIEHPWQDGLGIGVVYR